MKNNAILITGAAGGLGQALIRMAATLPGIDWIIATDIREVTTDPYAHFHGKVLSFVMDVTSENSIRNVKRELEKKGIVVKYLINNAGIFIFHPVTEMSEENINKIFRVNALSAVLTVNNFLNDIVETKGRVVQISSCSVKLPTMFQSYPASKIALEALSVSMRQELSLLGVKLILLRSGAINTDLIKNMGDIHVPAEKSRYGRFYLKFMEKAAEDVGKREDPDKVAGMVKKALTEKRPKNIYTINRNNTISFFSLFPEKIKEYLLRRAVR